MSIWLENISKSYNGLTAIHNLNLKIETGTTTVLIGPSGCGKSTLIRMIVGLIKNDTGKVFIEGEELSVVNLNSIRRKIGYVIQDGGLFPHINARRNVTLLAEYLKWDKEKIKSRVSELAELTNFPVDALERFPAELSGGQRQRVSLMRALMLDPKILLLDEPLGALDPLIRYDLQNDLREIFQNLNKTVVLVTHDLGEAAFFADKIILLKEGSVVQEGSLQSFVNNPQNDFVIKFIRAQRSSVNFSNN